MKVLKNILLQIYVTDIEDLRISKTKIIKFNK